MKTDNIFRFVAVRPPGARGIGFHVPGDDAAQQSIREAFEEMDRHGIPHMEARRRVGEKFVRSPAYVFIGPRGRLLVDSASALRSLLRNQAANPDFAGFRAYLAPILASSVPGPLDEFMNSEQYRAFKQSLWLGYYALVLNPKERPRDRELAALWIRACYLAESPDPESFARRAGGIFRMRPTVPFGWLAKAAVPVPKPPGDEPRLPGAALEARIRALAETRSALHGLLLAKLRQPESKPEKRKSGVLFGITSDLRQDPPWRLTSEDVKRHRGHLRTAAEVGIDHELTDLPEAVNQLDVKIAELTAAVHALRRRPRLVMSGSAFVRIQS